MSQLQALVGLRWRMVRSPRARVGLLGLGAALPLLLGIAFVVGQRLPDARLTFRATLLAPSLFLAFMALALVAPLVAGGGNELYPSGQLAAYPVRSRTVFAGSLLLAPLNLAWLTQVVTLFAVTGVVTADRHGVLPALVTLVVFIAAATIWGQSLAWATVAVRQSRAGRIALGIVVGAASLVLALLLALHAVISALNLAPTVWVVRALVDASKHRWSSWSATTLALSLLGLLGLRAGIWACDLALRRRTDLGRAELAPVRRRPMRPSSFRELVTVDQASVWRSTSLRRGCLVLALMPGAVAMLAKPTWGSLTLLPGLVAAGAGLLFGVNAFCLDGGGAVFVAAQPHPPRVTLAAKLVVVGETCLAAVLLAVALAATQVRHAPSLAEAVALTGSVMASTLLVVAACARLSVSRPHKADLRGPRDTPAPPATMALYSARLAFGTTWAGLALAGAGQSSSVVAPAALATAVLALAARSLVRTTRAWNDAITRSQVVTTVAFG